MKDDLTTLLDLEGKVAIVTGASRGIGASIAALLARAGARVGLVARSHDALLPVATNLPKDRRLILPADVSDKGEVEECVSVVTAEWGGVDILINNAGLVSAGQYGDISTDRWQEMLAVNLSGPFYTAKAVGPLMESSGWGRIVNITSISAQTGGVSGGVHYSASKGGLAALTKTLARDLGPSGVTVNAIAPGQIDTETDRQSSQHVAKIPLGRLGRPEDVARVVLFLVSPMGDYITGATIDVNGGTLMR